MLSPDEQYFADVCAGLGLAFTPWRFEYFSEWAKWEQGKTELSYWNPLNTTQHEPGSRPLGGAPNQNGGNPVQEYQDEATGVLATVQTLKAGQYYTLVLQSLAEQRVVPGSSNQIRTWGTAGFANVLDQGWTPAGSTLTEAEMQELDELRAKVAKLEAATFGSEARIDELNAAGVVPLETRVYNFESDAGPIGRRLANLEQHTGTPRP